jgi:hypothetical protein
MSTPDETLEKREQELENRIQMLERQLDRLNSRISDEVHPAPDLAARQQPAKPQQQYQADELPELSEEVLSWASQNSVLPRLATICFLMVIALGLRTITDSGLVDKLAGSILGMGYAAALMIFGWYKYGQENPLAPVFAACGAVLMSTIVVETHMHFLSLPLVPAYLTLMATGFGMALMSRRFNAFVPISVGVFGMCFAGAAIDYPHPYFPYLSLVLLTANVLGYFAAQLKRCSWLRWTVLIVTMIMVQLWGVRLGILLSKGEAIPPELAPDWYLPVLAVFFITFMGLSLLGIVYAGSQKVSRFDFSLPTVSVIWAFLLARHVTTASQLNIKLLGAAGLIFAIGCFSMALWCARRKVAGAPGSNTFALAGGTLMALALPAATGTFIMTLPLISLVAIGLIMMSRIWENGGIRGTGYLLNSYCCVALALALQGNGPGAFDPVNMLPAGALAASLIYQYQWCRRWPPPTESKLFGGFDHNDRTAMILLLAGLISSFYMVRIGLYHGLLSLPAASQKDAFSCAQTVIINSAAIGLILFAYVRRNREIRNVAILVTVAGGIKVFLYDLLGSHGLPLVFSIFSFGLAASIESLALGKWTKTAGPPDTKET